MQKQANGLWSGHVYSYARVQRRKSWDLSAPPFADQMSLLITHAASPRNSFISIERSRKIACDFALPLSFFSHPVLSLQMRWNDKRLLKERILYGRSWNLNVTSDDGASFKLSVAGFKLVEDFERKLWK